MSTLPWCGQYVLAAGGELLLAPASAPWSLSVIPEVGATVTVEATITPPHLLESANWHAMKTITADDMVVFPAPVTAIRISAADAGATVEVMS